MDKHVKFVDVGAIRVNLRPIIQQIQDHAQEWKNILGRCILFKTRMNMHELKNQVEVGLNSYIHFGIYISVFTKIEYIVII